MGLSMPSGLKGYNVYLDGQKVNAAAVPDDQPFPLQGLDSGTDYSGRITITAVDNAGNETAPMSLGALGKSAVTDSPTPSDLLPLETTNAIDALALAQIKPNTKVDGVLVGVYTPEGSYYKAYGGDRTTNSPLTIDDKMRYGSITKMYTCYLVCKAIDDGYLTLDDKLSTYVSGPAYWNKITIKNLMMMTSGIKDYLQQDTTVQQAYFLSPTTVFDPMPYIRSYQPLYEPGTSSSYSNSNTVLLGKILEWVDANHGTGRDIRTIIQEDLLTPLGLTETEWPTGNYMTVPYSRGWSDNLALPQVQATLGPFFGLLQTIGLLQSVLSIAGYGNIQTTPEVEFTACSTTWGDAAGALNGTIADLVTFGKAIANGTMLSPEMKQLREETFTTYLTYVPAHPWEGGGWMGFGLGVIQWGSWLGWIGSLAGYHSVMFANPNNGAVIAAIINHMTSGDPTSLFYEIAYLLYPETTAIQGPKIRASGIPSTARVGTPEIYQWHAPGDQDGNTHVPQKVPFYI
ncbi:serine hydrolase [Mycobacterium sp. 1245499.0]|uniref:serine hydrolase domain-containing protein n=1 Tax=Mycobacterium sp. 1245499.0 TaxID=1834074 RepID=UPI000A3F10FF|nr:serine hydrolase domain-containing protein [Mycobacterium sp. 1245499.0]